MIFFYKEITFLKLPQFTSPRHERRKKKKYHYIITRDYDLKYKVRN